MIFFNPVHINDIRTPCPVYKYVDDSTVFEICNQSRVPVMQDSANIIAQWSTIMICALTRVRLKKWSYVSVKIERMLNLCRIYIYINGTDIERFTQAKVLGVTISSDLSWNAHVDEIHAKARKKVYMIYQLKRAGNNQINLVRMYVTVIRPVVEYAYPVMAHELA